MAAFGDNGGKLLRGALEDALAHHGKPEIVSADQGAQFTGSAFPGVLTKQSITISMDGKGAWRDNVFLERLWRTIKYEEVYLWAYESVSDARIAYFTPVPFFGQAGLTLEGRFHYET